MLLSYLTDGNGYRVWDLEKRTVVKTRDLIFDDSVFPFKSKLQPSPAQVHVELPWPTQR
jgi:hypothetical protein